MRTTEEIGVVRGRRSAAALGEDGDRVGAPPGLQRAGTVDVGGRPWRRDSRGRAGAAVAWGGGRGVGGAALGRRVQAARSAAIR
ncbi:hypothetical protein E2562_029451 [Oryza meyeriana var. granulata]|uniref:DUF834 domain-containing protein n=1 Tax=Oryza meyeriana var. granulata TaxID=110450 RepID=A0A6G1E3Q7_9ORYZ|nr:hypothetical protein E2562_029451 [Oryza meyeriana var. granulata]